MYTNLLATFSLVETKEGASGVSFKKIGDRTCNQARVL